MNGPGDPVLIATHCLLIQSYVVVGGTIGLHSAPERHSSTFTYLPSGFVSVQTLLIQSTLLIGVILLQKIWHASLSSQDPSTSSSHFVVIVLHEYFGGRIVGI